MYYHILISLLKEYRYFSLKRSCCYEQYIKEESRTSTTMKYTARHIRKFLDQGRIDPDLWKTHFPSLLESRVPACGDCEDYKSNLCQGGKDPVDCFLGIQQHPVSEKSGKKRKSGPHPWDGRDVDRKRQNAVNKVFDQSKM